MMGAERGSEEHVSVCVWSAWKPVSALRAPQGAMYMSEMR